jgi:Pyridine nucleotide-disulphide oxidoreductase, dimerisation domain
VAPDQQLVPFSIFTDPELPRVGLSEEEAKAQSIAYRLFKIPMEAAMRASTNVGKHGERHQNAYPFGEDRGNRPGSREPAETIHVTKKNKVIISK